MNANKKAVLFLAEGFEEIEAVTPIDVLRRVGVAVTVAGVGGALRRGAKGLAVQADVAVADLAGEFDLMILPGGMPGAKNLAESPEVRALAQTMLAAGKLVAAICAAPALTLAAWGFLNGRRATCYPGMESLFPAGVTFSPERVVCDGNIITSRGPGTALEFSLHLAALLAGDAAAAKTTGDMLVE